MSQLKPKVVGLMTLSSDAEQFGYVREAPMQHARKPGNCDATGFHLECSVPACRLLRGAGGGMNNVAFNRDMPPSVTIANSPIDGPIC